jgi:hypothetical protein
MGGKMAKSTFFGQGLDLVVELCAAVAERLKREHDPARILDVPQAVRAQIAMAHADQIIEAAWFYRAITSKIMPVFETKEFSSFKAMLKHMTTLTGVIKDIRHEGSWANGFEFMCRPARRLADEERMIQLEGFGWASPSETAMFAFLIRDSLRFIPDGQTFNFMSLWHGKLVILGCSTRRMTLHVFDSGLDAASRMLAEGHFAIGSRRVK